MTRLSAQTTTRVTLAQPAALSAAGIRVDVEAGVIYNAAILTAGDTVGHPFRVDAKMLDQVASGINATSKGLRCRLAHPELAGGVFGAKTDPIEVLLGRVANARIEGDQVRGDVHFGAYAASTPKGDMRQYLLGIAREDPEAIGLSIVFEPSQSEPAADGGKPYGRVAEIFAVDFVGDPGANPGGLLSKGEKTMNPKLRAYLESIGLKAKATDAQAKAFWLGLKGVRLVKANTLVAALQEAAPAGVPEEPAPEVPDLAPAEGETREDFVARFVADEAMTAKYSDPAVREARAGEIYDALTEPEPELPPEAPVVAPAEAAVAARRRAPVSLSAEDVGKKVHEALAAERKRQGDIVALARKKRLPEDWARAHADNPAVTYDQFADLVELALANAPERVGVGADRNMETLSAGVADAICLRSGLKIDKPAERAKQFRYLSLMETGRAFLAAHGVDSQLMSRSEVCDLLLNRTKFASRVGLSMATGDFPYILANVLGKSLRNAYEITPTTWNLWARETTAPDFKQQARMLLSNAPALESMTEGSEYQYGSMTENRETYTLVKYGKGVKFTREMLINDDLSAFSRVMPAMGQMAAYLEDTVVYGVLTANAALSDAVALFHANHSNLTTGTLSVASLGSARALMRKQTHLDASTIIDITARSLIVPAALETTAEQLVASVVDPSKSNATPNPFANKLQIIATPHLDGTSTIQWYLAADPAQVDTVEVCFLEGERAPTLAEEEDFDTDCRKYKVRHHIVAKALDYRGLVRSSGAA